MKVYIDIIFLENIVMNIFLLYQTSLLLNQKAKKRRIIASGIIGGIYTCIIIVIKLNTSINILYKIFISLIMTYISFVPKKINIYIKETIIFYMSNLLLIGSINLISNIFNISENNIFTIYTVYAIGILITVLARKYIWHMYKCEIKKNTLLFKVFFKVEDMEYKYMGFLDTGNTLKYNEYMVCFAKRKEGSDLKQNYNISFNTINGKSFVKGSLVKNAKIEYMGKWHTVPMIICFKDEIENELGYDMLLNYNIFEKIGGIKI